jgi:4-hydroxy-tetrahydrodipicolinate synthase
MEPNKLKEKMKGVLALLVTPFKDDLDLDLEGLKQNVDFLIENKVPGLIPTGSTGEFSSLTLEEHKEVIKTVVDKANGKALVVPGTAHSSTKVTIELTKYAEDVGADGAMIVPPYYLVGDDEGFYNHYKQVADQVNIGIMLYNNPHTSKICMSFNLLNRLSKIDNIIAIKEVSGNVNYFLKVIKTFRDRWAVIPTAETPLTLLGYIFGASPALITMEWNPKKSIEFLEETAIKRNYEKAYKMIEECFEPFNILYERYMAKGIPGYIQYTKAALDMLGRVGGRVRPPLTDLNCNEKEELKKVLDKLGLLP